MHRMYLFSCEDFHGVSRTACNLNFNDRSLRSQIFPSVTEIETRQIFIKFPFHDPGLVKDFAESCENREGITREFATGIKIIVIQRLLEQYFPTKLPRNLRLHFRLRERERIPTKILYYGTSMFF